MVEVIMMKKWSFAFLLPGSWLYQVPESASEGFPFSSALSGNNPGDPIWRRIFTDALLTGPEAARKGLPKGRRLEWLRGCLLVAFWGRSGVAPGSLWSRSGVAPGALWDRSGVALGSLWGRSGGALGWRWGSRSNRKVIEK